MRKIAYLFLLVASVFFSSCGGKDVEVVSKYPNGKPMKEFKIAWEGDNKLVVGETRYYPNGQKEIEGGYDKAGKKTGIWTSWYPSGKISKEENYLADKKNGRQRDFYESGKPNFESNYKNNIPDGDWIFYDGQGNKKSRIVFKDGRKVGQ